MTVIENQKITEAFPKVKGKDNHVLAFGKETSIVLNNCYIRADTFEEALKFSKCRDVVVKNCIIVGGVEDCLDIVRGRNYSFIRCVFSAAKQTKQSVTVKGGVKNVLFKECMFHGSPSNCHIQLGDYTIYDRVRRPKTTNVVIETCEFYGGSNVWRSLHADPPVFKGIDYADRGYKVPDWLVYLYFRVGGLFFDWQKVDAEELKLEYWEKL